jgi:hypothetical protein
MNHYNSECGTYTVTHAMCLTFGYGLSNAKLIFPEDYQNRMSSRRKRYVLDLLTNGSPSWVRNRRDCYVGCTSEALLKLHYRRNQRFYPRHDEPKV